MICHPGEIAKFEGELHRVTVHTFRSFLSAMNDLNVRQITMSNQSVRCHVFCTWTPSRDLTLD